MRVHACGRVWAVLAGCALSLAGACGDAAPAPDVILRVGSAWNKDPASTAEIGYEVTLGVDLPGRYETCFPLPDLRFTVNGSEYAITAGDCDAEISVRAWPVRTDADTVVTLSSGRRQLGAATFRGLFPGPGALQLVSPSDGRVRMGETLTLAIPANWLQPFDHRVFGFVHWLDLDASVPAFFSGASANAGDSVVEVQAPMLTGRALLVVQPLVYAPAVADVQTCTGFSSCGAGSSGALGPVAIEVIP